MTTRTRAHWLLGAALACLLSVSAQGTEAPLLVVYKQASCTCCRPWIKYMEANGFRVEVHDVNDIQAIKREHGIPSAQSACHTTLVDGYVFEGHLSADDVRRVLREHPPFKGLIVPGMPKGAPGMEGPDPVPYDVLALGADGNVTVYRRQDPVVDQ